jgi:hypothetical protein
MMPLIVTGTDTGIGKTVVCAMLTLALDAVYWKPIQAGTNGGTHMIILDISCGVLSTFWYQQLSPAIGGLQLLATIMPVTGDTANVSDRCATFAQRWAANPDGQASAAWLDYILFNQWSRADLNLTEVSYLVRAFRLNVPYAMDVRPSLNSPNRLYTDLTDHSSLTGTFRFKDAVPTWVAAPSTPVFFNAVDFHFVDIPFAQATITSGLYRLPATLPLTTGQAFDVSIDDEIAGDPGTRYRFNNWSDGGARTHTFTAGAALTKLTAQFQTQHELTIKVTPANGGSVSGAGWYNQGVAAVMTATPAPGYHFAGYSTTLGNTNPLSLLMNGPLQVTATFMQDGPPSLYAAASGVPDRCARDDASLPWRSHRDPDRTAALP